MDIIKIQDFARDYPGQKFPEYATLPAQLTSHIREKIRERMGLPNTVTDLELVKAVVDRELELPQINADEKTPDFPALLRENGISPEEKILINWYRFDEIDEMSLSDFSTYFDDLWYPAADHIDIFDYSLSWMLSVAYSGSVSLLRL
jgi:hypothetical protein